MSRLDPDCLFCRIVAGQIPAEKVLDTDAAVAFLDLHPVHFGHVLVVPKAHHADLSELPEDIAAAVGGLLPRLTRAIRAAAGASGLNVVVNNGRAAGQTVFHGHWHLIPRSEGDGFDWPWSHLTYPEGEMGRMRERISRAVASGPA